MLRASITKFAAPSSILLRQSSRSISISAVRMGEGDTGAPRGAAQGDAFTKREQASEDYAIRQRELEKLQALKEKVAAHKAHLEKLDQEIDADMKKQGS